MPRFRVTSDKLNVREFIPHQLPEPLGIVGIVNEDSTFEGEEVDASEIPNPLLGKWYVDNSHHFYWGGGIETVSAAPISVALKPEVAIGIKIENPLLTRLQIDQIWSTGETGERAVVAILDSGIALNCPDLTDAVGPDPLRMKNLVAGSNTMDDDLGHGSHCAGIIASRNNLHAAGIAKGCKLYVGKISDSHSGISVANMIKGLRWAGGLEIDSPHDVDIISMSNGSLLNIPDMKPTIDQILAKGKIVVCSIGNRSPQSLPVGGIFPAMFSGVISVGAVNLENAFQEFSFEFNNLTISCPGTDIFSYWINGDTRNETGTSQSASVCAGVVALLVSKLKKLGAQDIQSRILTTLLSSNFNVSTNGFQYRFIEPLQLFNSI